MGRKNRLKERGKRSPGPQGLQQESESASASLASPWQFAGLQVLVFTAGAVLMGLEIAGSRVLAPHFGNSVFVWGSLISVFLIALSLGYYVGGRLADWNPSRWLLNAICITVSLFIVAIALFAYPLCERLVENGLGEQSGPFAASLLLFLPPSVGMGMVSPFAIRLATPSVTSVGKVSGAFYALSTLGSIAGTLLTTFVLIPWIGLSAILKSLGLLLLIASLLTLPWRSGGTPLTGFSALVVLLAGGLLALVSSPEILPPGSHVVAAAETPYHQIQVVDHRDVRSLRFNRYVESAIRTAPPYPSLSQYTYYFHLAFLVQPRIERSVFIGAGGGVGPRSFHMHNPAMKIDVVDIDRAVLDLARDHFFLEQSPNIATIAADGRRFLRESTVRYDCVVLDAFTIGGRIPFHLVTREFLEMCQQRMTNEGVFVMNINSAVEGPRARIYQSMYRTIDAVFPHTYVFAEGQNERPRLESTNIILVASKRPTAIAPQAWSRLAAQYESKSYITSDLLQQLVRDLVEQPGYSDAPLFTDDYAPIETMAF